MARAFKRIPRSLRRFHRKSLENAATAEVDRVLDNNFIAYLEQLQRQEPQHRQRRGNIKVVRRKHYPARVLTDLSTMRAGPSGMRAGPSEMRAGPSGTQPVPSATQQKKKRGRPSKLSSEQPKTIRRSTRLRKSVATPVVLPKSKIPATRK